MSSEVVDFIIQVLAGLAVIMVLSTVAFLRSDRFRTWIKGRRKYFLLGVALGLVGLISVFYFLDKRVDNTTSVDPSWQMLIDDRFDSVESRNNWYYGDSETPYGVSYLEQKKDAMLYSVSCPENIDSPIKVFYRQLKKPDTLSDGFVELDFEMENAGEQPGYGIRFRSKNDRFYLFWVNDTNQTFQVAYYDGNDFFDVYPITYTEKIKPKAGNRLGIMLRGTRVELYINNELVGEYLDNRQLSGVIHIAANVSCPGSSQYKIDNLVVYSP